MKNYDKINFVRFKPIFENLEKIITLYQAENNYICEVGGKYLLERRLNIRAAE